MWECIMKVQSNSLKQSREYGAHIAAVCAPGDVIGLIGELGAGKTEFVRGFVDCLNDNAGVRSPSFSLVNSYETPAFPVHHFDFYRLSSDEELVEIGFEEYIDGNGVCLIEWADMFPDILPEHTSYVRFSQSGIESRIIDIDDRLAHRAGLDAI